MRGPAGVRGHAGQRGRRGRPGPLGKEVIVDFVCDKHHIRSKTGCSHRVLEDTMAAMVPGATVVLREAGVELDLR